MQERNVPADLVHLKMLENLKKQTEENDMLLILVQSSEYSEKITELLHELASIGRKVCYVTVNKPSKTLMGILEKKGASLDNFYFVDCLGQVDVESVKNCVFISSPNQLSEISLTISKVVSQNNPKILCFDSLATLLAYEEPQTVIKFAHSIITDLRNSGVKGIFINPVEESKALIADLDMFVDKEIKA